MADLSVAFADDEQVGVTFSEVDDKGNPVADVEQVTMTSEDESIATIGTLHDGTTPAIVASGKVGATIVDCETPSGLKASIAVAVGTSAPVGLSATFGTPEKQ